MERYSEEPFSGPISRSYNGAPPTFNLWSENHKVNVYTKLSNLSDDLRYTLVRLQDQILLISPIKTVGKKVQQFLNI